jgi:FkbM family methyltransferase
MIRPHEPGWLNRIGKSLAPSLTGLFMRGPGRQGLSLLETYLAFLQGKGAGTGWELDEEVRLAASLTRRPGAIIIDAGACEGAWSKRMLSLLGSMECHIFQFEASPYCIAALRSLPLPRTTLVEAAVGEEAGEATFYTPPIASSIGSLHPRRDTYFQQYPVTETMVKVVTIDGFLRDCGIDTVDFLKMDIEGHELAALRGARQSIENHRIRALTFEFGSGNINSRTYFHDFWDLLHPCGYTIKRICPGGVLYTVSEYYEDLEYFRGATNYLALSEPPGAK